MDRVVGRQHYAFIRSKRQPNKVVTGDGQGCALRSIDLHDAAIASERSRNVKVSIEIEC